VTSATFSEASFDVFPAIDLLDGQSVRLRQGRRETAHVVHGDPLEQLAWYAKAGARWVHVVNLNAAFGDSEDAEGAAASAEILRSMVAFRSKQGLEISIQVGGGVRSAESVTKLFSLGVQRVVIGTWAVHEPDAVCEMARNDASRVVVALETKGGALVTQGWTQAPSTMTPEVFGKRLFNGGVRLALCTAVENDGMMTGADPLPMVDLAQKTGLRILASGGVACAEDVRKLSQAAAQGIAGVVVGKALHSDAMRLEDALAFQST
jgi:phosphoribosylformimino-5-aminoimidazole carboxamide ribotide isomerase